MTSSLALTNFKISIYFSLNVVEFELGLSPDILCMLENKDVVFWSHKGIHDEIIQDIFYREKKF